MKIILFLFVIITITPSITSQNILEALQLKEEQIEKYTEGELEGTDTFVDLKNGYYMEYFSDNNQNLTILRQAAIFNNKDKSKTLGISTSKWDFQCFNYKTNFYLITEEDKIKKIGDSTILPLLTINEFVIHTDVIKVLNKYLPKLQGSYLSEGATINDLLTEIYDIKYIIPQRGTNLVATLAVCDYIPTNEIEIKEKDWSIIVNNSATIYLDYDKKSKSFKRK